MTRSHIGVSGHCGCADHPVLHRGDHHLSTALHGRARSFSRCTAGTASVRSPS